MIVHHTFVDPVSIQVAYLTELSIRIGVNQPASGLIK